MKRIYVNDALRSETELNGHVGYIVRLTLHAAGIKVITLRRRALAGRNKSLSERPMKKYSETFLQSDKKGNERKLEFFRQFSWKYFRRSHSDHSHFLFIDDPRPGMRRALTRFHSSSKDLKNFSMQIPDRDHKNYELPKWSSFHSSLLTFPQHATIKQPCENWWKPASELWQGHDVYTCEKFRLEIPDRRWCHNKPSIIVCLFKLSLKEQKSALPSAVYHKFLST